MVTDTNEVISDTSYSSYTSLNDVNNVKPLATIWSQCEALLMSASWTDLSSENSSDEEDKKKERIGNTDWCTCRKSKKDADLHRKFML